ncbi:aldolase [Penicillium macrosclerotiorum]|uniref:aldolase n=1 Tax=Penicillium macrosclerotiorum TaxID=303699 RepID=UPI0025483DE9|nr:aldolase [Penicillium macrosclerotiorum]KAJ5693025.1 aldolase [Penicillium macrosclerotiorum]
MAVTRTPPPFGVYCPMVTFFKDDESVDYESITHHVHRLLQSGVSGIVIHGSNGEATHLLHEERAQIIRHVREVSCKEYPKNILIAGCSASSVYETILFIREAQEAGADYALILPPSYWSAAMSKPVLKNFYTQVASKSALPVIIYNFPGVTSGIELDSDFIIDVASTCPQVVGAKLTCGNLGKLQRLSAALPGDKFAPLAGKADFLLPGLVAGSHGVISALANVVPKLHVEVIRLYRAGHLEKAQEIQAKLSVADWALLKLGISGVKAASTKWFGYGNPRPRLPLPTADIESASPDLLNKLGVVVELEKQLPN